VRSEAGYTAATAFTGGLNPTYIFKQTGLGTPVRLFKHHSNSIDGAGTRREARKLLRFWSWRRQYTAISTYCWWPLRESALYS